MKRSIFAFFAALIAFTGLRAGIVEDFYLTPERVKARVDSVVAATPADSLPDLLLHVDELFFDPTSKTYCEGIAALYLQAALPRIADETEREVALWKLNDVCALNAEGTPASDFRFDLDGGPRGLSLSRYLKGKPLCIVFYDPDCHHCSEVINELSPSLAGNVNVLAVCVESTPERWEETRGALPLGWARAFDRSDIAETEIYMLRSLPSIYLLDADHNVVLKNPSASRLLNYLER